MVMNSPPCIPSDSAVIAPTARCTYCKMSSHHVDKFKTVYRLLCTEHLCPRCIEELAIRRARQQFFIWLAAFLGALALAMYAKTDQGFWIVASLLLLYLLLHLALIPHEIGHALAAWLMGFELTQIQIGSGRPLWAVIVAGVEISYGSVPFGGSTKFGAPGARWFRARMIVVSIAGPAANLACFWTTIRLVNDYQSQPHILPNLYVIPVWLLANLLVVVANLTPKMDRSTARLTDGLMVWRMLWKPIPEEMLRNLPIVAPLNKSFRFLRKSIYESAERSARRAYELGPERPETRLALGMALCYGGNGVEGEPLLRGLLHSGQPTEIARHSAHPCRRS
jgi:hypothetical protein